MKKRLWIWVVGMLTAMLCVGCGGHAAEDTQIEYSNLVDAPTQKQVAQLLQDHGVTEEQTETLMAWADDFNARVTSGTLAEGMQTAAGPGVDYSGWIVESKEAEDGTLRPEANCRLTSYLLLKNFIHTNGSRPKEDAILLFDEEAMDTYAPFALSEEERSDYGSLFGWVPVDGADTLEQQTQRILDAWTERDIQVGGDGISLITVYLDLPFDSVRFVGHTGVLVDTGDGLLFVEKYGPQLPFQATKFGNREELKQYLLSRADLYGDKTELPPIVMENNQVL